MKKISILILVFCILAGCTGWSTEEKEMFMKSCRDVGVLDCDCALDKYMEKFPTFDEYISGGEEKSKIADEVTANCRSWTKEEKEMFLKNCAESGPMDCECLMNKFIKNYPRYDDFVQGVASDTSWVKKVAGECGGKK